MNKVTTINLGGNAYQLEEGAYEALRAYMETARLRLAGNPDKDEILADIERAIAEKCSAALGTHKNVVSTREIGTIIAEMGPVEDGTASAAEPAAADGPAPTGASPAGEPQAPPRRLYRIKEGRMISGVCNGIAAYFGCDPTIVRLLYALLALLTFGVALLAYIIMTIVIPSASTAAEKAAAHGSPSTAQDFIRRAREGYYEGARTMGDRRAHREWKRRFKREIRDWSKDFKREMRENADEWTGHWSRWRPHPSPHWGYWVASSFLWLIGAILTLLWIVALISLVATGAVFGVFAYGAVPLWFAIITLTLIYALAMWPIKAARRAAWYGGRGVAHRENPSLFLLVLLLLVLWYGNRHFLQVHEALMAVPPAIHQFFASLRHWWTGR